MDEMKYQCRLDRDGLCARRDGTPVYAYLVERPSGLAREHGDIADQSSNDIVARRTRVLEGSQVVSKRKRMMKLKGHESLMAFAEIERLIGKVYFRFSHLFFHHPTLRDFWWEMAMGKERCACNLTVMNAVVKNDPRTDNLALKREKTDQLRQRLTSYLRKGTPTIAPEEASSIARTIEACEIDVIDSDFLNAGYFPAAFLFSRGDNYVA